MGGFRLQFHRLKRLNQISRLFRFFTQKRLDNIEKGFRLSACQGERFAQVNRDEELPKRKGARGRRPHHVIAEGAALGGANRGDRPRDESAKSLNGEKANRRKRGPATRSGLPVRPNPIEGQSTVDCLRHDSRH